MFSAFIVVAARTTAGVPLVARRACSASIFGFALGAAVEMTDRSARSANDRRSRVFVASIALFLGINALAPAVGSPPPES